MKVTAINGSPRGRHSSTQKMLAAFLRGAEQAGAQTQEVFLAKKKISPCQGCFSCWLKTPGSCVLKDDMEELRPLLEATDLLVLGTPLYYDHITAQLKTFMDRSIPGCEPYFQKDAWGECRHTRRNGGLSPKLVLLSNCGFPERSHFQVLSHWIERVARNMKTEVLAEIYASQGGLLSAGIPQLAPVIDSYLEQVEAAARQLIRDGAVSEETKSLLSQNFLPDEVYIAQANQYFATMLAARKGEK